MVCTVEILYEKKAYSPGETVSGYILLHVTGSLSVESIILVVDKESGVQIEEIEAKEETSTTNERAVRHLGKFFIYKESQRKIDSGVYKFPFKFRISEEEGASVDYKKSFDKRRVSVLNRYVSKCEVRIYGIFRPVAYAKKEIILVEKEVQPSNPKKTFHSGAQGCICFRPPPSIYVEIDSAICPGKKHELKIFSEGSKVERVDANLQMTIKTCTTSFSVSIPCRAEILNNSFYLSLDGPVPSETARNEFFSIFYAITLGVTLRDGEVIGVVRPVSVHGESPRRSYTLPEMPESVVHPEKHLLLQAATDFYQGS